MAKYRNVLDPKALEAATQQAANLLRVFTDTNPNAGLVEIRSKAGEIARTCGLPVKLGSERLSSTVTEIIARATAIEKDH